MIFLHGSGQSHDTVTYGDDVAQDVLSPLLTNQGGVTWVENAPEPAYVLVPQAPARDLRDDDGEGGWRSADTRSLLLGLIDELIADNPDIDTDRIYLTGLSLGAMGSWKLLTDADPAVADRFAGALLMNGTPANLGGVSGDTPEERAKAVEEAIAQVPYENVSVPIWLTHADTDHSVNVVGSRLPFAALSGGNLSEDGMVEGDGVSLDASDLIETYAGTNVHTGKEVRYTEYNYGDGDNMLELGMVTPIAHFSWEAAYKDQDMIDWLFAQRKGQ